MHILELSKLVSSGAKWLDPLKLDLSAVGLEESRRTRYFELQTSYFVFAQRSGLPIVVSHPWLRITSQFMLAVSLQAVHVSSQSVEK